MVTDRPFGEAKEFVGGNWFLVAGRLDEAAALAADNLCMQCRLFYPIRAIDIRPVDPEKASEFARTTETPSRDGA
jgi:hypothetical protein